MRQRCPVCGIVPREFWLFGGTVFWYVFLGEWLCPTCVHWARRILDA